MKLDGMTIENLVKLGKNLANPIQTNFGKKRKTM